MKYALLIAALVAMSSVLSGCIPLMVGGYIGYEMSQKDAHAEFCTQHVGDPSCHP